MKNTQVYTIVKLPGKNEGYAVFDSLTQATVVGSRCSTRREAIEVKQELLVEFAKEWRS